MYSPPLLLSSKAALLKGCQEGQIYLFESCFSVQRVKQEDRWHNNYCPKDHFPIVLDGKYGSAISDSNELLRVMVECKFNRSQ